MADKDLYRTLGVSRDASQEEIKKAYRTLARKYHPDVNPGDNTAEERFKDVSGAFDTLGDATKRKLYDEFGQAGLRDGFDPDKARAYHRWGQTGSGGGFGGFSDFGSAFGDIFGGAAQSQRRQKAGRKRGDDAETPVDIDLVTAIQGGEVTINMTRPRACDSCDGTGVTNGARRTCDTCRGSGQVHVNRGPLNVATICQTCNGSGSHGPMCLTCAGSGSSRKSSQLNVKIPPGVADGGRIRLVGQGNLGARGGRAGDLYLRINVKPHPTLRREGQDLYLTIPVSIAEAVNGGKVGVPLPNGGNVTLNIPKRSQNGRKLRLRGKGAPSPKGDVPGDLYVVLDVRLPDSDDSDLESLVKKLDQYYTNEVQRPSRL